MLLFQCRLCFRFMWRHEGDTSVSQHNLYVAQPCDGDHLIQFGFFLIGVGMEIPVSVRVAISSHVEDSLINITVLSATLHLVKKAPDSHPGSRLAPPAAIVLGPPPPRRGCLQERPKFPPRCTSEDLAAGRSWHQVAKSEGSEVS